MGLFLISTWELDISDPQLSAHLVVAGVGFGLVIAPLFVTAMESGHRDYQATAASLVTVSRMIGMALGLAALSAWGMEHFQGLTAGLELPIQQAGETTQSLELRIQEYQDGLNQAGTTLFQAFFRAAAALMVAGLVPALWLAGKARAPKKGPEEIKLADSP